MGAHMEGTSFDHDVTIVVAGDAENLRARLADALEQLEYRVLNENPIQARRVASDLAKSGCSQDILDYQRSLDIGLKAVGANSTRVTFAYTVNGVWMGYLTKGDRNTLTREAGAIVALAQSRAALLYCPACGSDGTGGARFCRQCGAPVASTNPPELDLLSLNADANASFKNIVSGAICALMLAPALLLLTIFLFPDGTLDGKLLGLMAVLLCTFGFLGLGFLIPGLWRLGRAIKRRPEGVELPAPSRRGVVEGANPPVVVAAALPPQSIQHTVHPSVTEATTGLLPQEVKQTNDLS